MCWLCGFRRAPLADAPGDGTEQPERRGGAAEPPRDERGRAADAAEDAPAAPGAP
jgi:hypothetical protein